MTFSTLLCISFSLQLHYACQRINYAHILFYTFFSYLLRYVFFISYVYKRSCDKNDIKFRIMFCQSTLFVINLIKYTYFIIYTIFLFLLGFLFCLFFYFLGLHLWHIEVLMLGVQSTPQPQQSRI